MDVLLASNNAHKRQEIEGIIQAFDLGVHLWQPRDLEFSFDVVEDGVTFSANAWAKAHGLRNLIAGNLLDGVTASESPSDIASRVNDRFEGSLPAILADDSGLAVDFLGGRPGVLTARYGHDREPAPRDDTERWQLLLSDLRDAEDRGAEYVCNAILLVGPASYFQAQSVWRGEIATEPHHGETGFGYDPVFWLSEYHATVAQIPQLQKDRISHRAQAVSAVFRAAGLEDSGST